MRIPSFLATPLLAGALLTSACGHGYYSTEVGVGTRYGPALDLYGYSPDYWGDWRVGYRQWQPVTIYDYNGAYYTRNIRNSRPVQVYRTPRGYVLPPRDRDWNDRRFNTRRRPSDDDYRRARPRP